MDSPLLLTLFDGPALLARLPKPGRQLCPRRGPQQGFGALLRQRNARARRHCHTEVWERTCGTFGPGKTMDVAKKWCALTWFNRLLRKNQTTDPNRNANRRTRILVVCVQTLQEASDKNLLKFVDSFADLTHLVCGRADSHFLWVTPMRFNNFQHQEPSLACAPGEVRCSSSRIAGALHPISSLDR
jgi:hypothetical protein